MAIHREAIDDFLAKWEQRKLRGYVPCNPKNYFGGDTGNFRVIGASGVTIATGLDLGQQSMAELKKYGISDALCEKFRPYVGLRRGNALSALRREVLVITDAECDQVSRAVHGAYIGRAQRYFERFSRMLFDDIPAQAQCVVVSLVYSLGSPHKHYPAVWRALWMGKWHEAATLLLADNEGYDATRRRDEGALLDTIED